MAAGDNVQGDAAVVRAKAFMVQLTRSMIASKQWVRGASPATNSKSVTGGLPETEAKLPVVSSFGDAVVIRLTSARLGVPPPQMQLMIF
jgi:hypothetical protein